jgi:hypothetical protein
MVGTFRRNRRRLPMVSPSPFSRSCAGSGAEYVLPGPGVSEAGLCGETKGLPKAPGKPGQWRGLAGVRRWAVSHT